MILHDARAIRDGVFTPCSLSRVYIIFHLLELMVLNIKENYCALNHKIWTTTLGEHDLKGTLGFLLALCSHTPQEDHEVNEVCCEQAMKTALADLSLQFALLDEGPTAAYLFPQRETARQGQR
jgi:hypothetical protein